MAKTEFDIQEYLGRGVERIVSDSLRASLKNPRETAFLVRFAAASRAASRKRSKLERQGEHIPPFLISSITSACNLHCAGCYSRCSCATEDTAPADQLTGEEWNRIFAEAEELGVSFILLAGGEPMLRRDVIEAAADHPRILFPIFTNGTVLDEAFLTLFDRSRNLLPIFSIEGDQAETDSRRGPGVYHTLLRDMEEMQKRGLLFGVSVTVTRDNLRQVLSDAFLDSLSGRGCKAVIYVEYVPVTEESVALAPEEKERALLRRETERLRRDRPELVFISFPGDEKSSGGCLAAGRGFFHINSHGGAEPCPFSPYSDVNVRDTSLRAALRSGLFQRLVNGDCLLEEHAGGCVLFEKRHEVEALLNTE